MTREERRNKAEQACQERMDQVTADLERRLAQEKLAQQGNAFLKAHPKAPSQR